MKINSEYYKELRKKTEDILKDYPYYKMAKEVPEINILKLIDKKVLDLREDAFNVDYIENIIKSVNYVLDRLDYESKKIIDGCYFRDDISNDELQKELMIDRNKFYRLKRKSLEKFMIVLAY